MTIQGEAVAEAVAETAVVAAETAAATVDATVIAAEVVVANAEARAVAAESVAQAIGDAAFFEELRRRVDDLQGDIDECAEKMESGLARLDQEIAGLKTSVETFTATLAAIVAAPSSTPAASPGPIAAAVDTATGQTEQGITVNPSAVSEVTPAGPAVPVPARKKTVRFF